jgi:hypothetical protein
MQPRPVIRLSRDDVPAIARWAAGLFVLSLVVILLLDPQLPAHLSHDKDAPFLAIAPLCDVAFAAAFVATLKLPVAQTRFQRVALALTVLLGAVFFATMALGAGDSTLPNLVTGDIGCVAFAAAAVVCLPCVWWEWLADPVEGSEARVGVGVVFLLVSLAVFIPAVVAVALVLSREGQLDWLLRGFVFAGIALLVAFAAYAQAGLAHRKRQRLNGTYVARRKAPDAPRTPAIPKRAILASIGRGVGSFVLLVAIAAITLLILDATLFGRLLRSRDHRFIAVIAGVPEFLFALQLFADLPVPRSRARRCLALGITALFSVSATAYWIELAAPHYAPNRLLAVSLVSSAAAIALCLRVLWRERGMRRPIASSITLALELPALAAAHLIVQSVHPIPKDWSEALLIPFFWMVFCSGIVMMSGKPDAAPHPAPEPVAVSEGAEAS